MYNCECHNLLKAPLTTLHNLVREFINDFHDLSAIYNLPTCFTRLEEWLSGGVGDTNVGCEY